MRSDMDQTVLLANNTISAFNCKHSTGGATTHIGIANAWVRLTTHLSTLRGWTAELDMLADIQRTVYSEVTRQLNVMAQGRESSPVIDRSSNQLCYANNLSSSHNHWRNHWGVGGRGPDLPKIGRTPNFLHSFRWIECDYITDCTKLGRPVYFFCRRVVIP